MGLGLERLPPTVLQQTIEALPRDNFKKVFVDALFARVQKDPQSVALTWMSGPLEGMSTGSSVQTLLTSYQPPILQSERLGTRSVPMDVLIQQTIDNMLTASAPITAW